MTGPRLTDQLQLAFAPVDDGLSSAAVGEGAEPVVAKGEPERPVVTPSVMEAVCERENLKKALRRVKANKGSQRWTLSAGQLIDIVKWNLLRHIPVKMRGGRR